MFFLSIKKLNLFIQQKGLAILKLIIVTVDRCPSLKKQLNKSKKKTVLGYVALLCDRNDSIRTGNFSRKSWHLSTNNTALMPNNVSDVRQAVQECIFLYNTSRHWHLFPV